jgi:hypothetical protein
MKFEPLPRQGLSHKIVLNHFSQKQFHDSGSSDPWIENPTRRHLNPFRAKSPSSISHQVHLK